MLNRAGHEIPKESLSSGTPADWRKTLAYITGTVDGELPLRREYVFDRRGFWRPLFKAIGPAPVARFL